jgi:dihydroflavonol-4-reductase
VKEKILVTGATGFLGSNICRLLIQSSKYQVIGLKRSNSRLELLGASASQIEWIEADLLEVGSIYEAMVGIDYVIHAGAIVSFDPRDFKKMMQTNVSGTANIVNSALENNVKKLIHVSSIAAIGRKLESNIVNESNKWTNSKFNTNYAVSKFLGEQEVWRGMEEGLNMAIVNPSVILGAQFWDQSTGRMFDKVFNGLKFYTTGINGFVDVRDVAKYIVFLLESEISGERFILNGENLSYKHVFESIADILNKPKPSIAINPILQSIAWRVEWLKSRFSKSRPLITKETAMTSSLSFVYENKKSLQYNPNFQYTPIEETIKIAAEILKESKKINIDYGIMPL